MDVGDPWRAAAGRALWSSVACSALFTAFAILTTQDRSLRAHSPWQDDPYDVVVSFTELVVPVLAVALAVRMARCPRQRPVVAGRVRDLLRGARVLTGAIGLTAATDWVAVMLGVHASAWGEQGRGLIAALSLVTLTGLLSVAVLRRAGQRAGPWRGYAPVAEDPDWVEDLIGLLGETTRRWGRAGPSLGRLSDWLQRVVVDGPHGLRRHRVAAALAAAVLVGLALAVVQTLREGIDANPVVDLRRVAVAATISASGLFAVLLAAGSYLRILRSTTSAPTERRRERSPLLIAGFVAATSVPVSVAFRDQIGAALGYPINGPGRLAVIVATVAAATALTAGLVSLAARRRHS